MRRALAGLFIGSFIGAIAACTGGPGPLPDGTGQPGQGGTSSGQDESTPAQSGSGGTASTSTATGTTPPPITTSGYDTTCSTTTDCAAVYEGSPCEACRCPNAAINTSDLTKYMTALSNAAGSCPSSGPECKCAIPTVNCNASKHCAVTFSSPGDAG